MPNQLTNPTELFQSLLRAGEEQLKVSEKLSEKRAIAQKLGQEGPLPLTSKELLKKIKKAIIAKQLETVKELVDNYPKIKQTKYWKTKILRMAVGGSSAPVCQYLVDKGAELHPSYNSDFIAFRAIAEDDLEMFKWLESQKQVAWEFLEKGYWYLYHHRSPKVTAHIVKTQGVDFGPMNLKGYGASEQGRDVLSKYIKELWRISLEQPEWLEVQLVTQELLKTKVVKEHHGLMEAAVVELWQDLLREEKIEPLLGAIRAGLKPQTVELVSLWFQTLKNDKQKSWRWLSGSTALVEAVKQHWPNDPRQQLFNPPQACEGTYSKIKWLVEQGFDITAKTRRGDGNNPWIFEFEGSITRQTLGWLMTNCPQVLLAKNSLGDLLETRVAKVNPTEMAKGQKMFMKKAIGKPDKITKKITKTGRL